MASITVKNPITGTKHDIASIGADVYTLLNKDSSLKQKAASVAGLAGTALGLPEFGISESVRPQASAQSTPSSTKSTKSTKSTGDTNTGPSGSQGNSGTNVQSSSSGSSSSGSSSKSSSSGGSSSKSNSSIESLKKAADSDAKAAAEAERKRIEAWEKAQRGEITSAYADVFKQLDSLLAQYPSQREEMLGYVENMANTQRQLAESERERGLAELSTQEEKQYNLAKSSLRDLEEDIRNSLMAAGRYLGVRGSGDSSASGQASEALSKAGQKARSGVLSTRDQAIAEIGKRADEVNRIAKEQLLNVEQFKASKAMEIMNFFQSKMEALESERRNATAERGRALAQIIQNTQGQFIEAMRNLDAETRNYKRSIDMWQAQRTAEMEDYAQKIAMQKSYSGPTSTSYNQALSLFDSLVARGIPSEQARQIANEQTGIFLPEGLQGEDEYAGVASPSQLFIDQSGNLSGPYGSILGGEVDLSGVGGVSIPGMVTNPFERAGL